MEKYNTPQEQDQADKVLFRLIIIMCFGIALMYCTSCTPSKTMYLAPTSKPNYEWLKEKQSTTKYARHIKWSCPKF